MDLKDQIKNEISKGNTEKALLILGELSKSGRVDLENEALILQSRFKKWQKEKNLGVTTEDTELRRIEFSILEAIKEGSLKNKRVPKEISAQRKGYKQYLKFLWKAIGVIFILWGLILFTFRFDIILEFFRGTTNIEFADIFTPVLFFSIGGLFLFWSKKRLK